MKRVIGGKRYDTGVARRVAKVAIARDAHGPVTETLYRKRTGECFLHQVGGANGEETLLPISPGEIHIWAVRAGVWPRVQEQLASLAGPPGRGERFGISFSAAEAKFLRKVAADNGLNGIQEALRHLVGRAMGGR